MTAAGTPAPQVGETITTIEGLDAMPAHSVLAVEGGAVAVCDQTFPGLPGSSFWRVTSHSRRERSPYLLVVSPRWTVLFRPDAPQPAPTDDAVERAARVLFRRNEYADQTWDGDDTAEMVRDAYRIDARAALAAARAGEAECSTECDPDCDTPCHEDHQVPAKREHEPDHCPGAIAEVLRLRRALAVQPGGEVDCIHSAVGLIPTCLDCGSTADVDPEPMDPDDAVALVERGGEAVDREAIAAVHVAIPNSDVGGPLLCARCMFAWPCDAARLAARGDAAPTEPRWGWDLGPDDPRGVRTQQDEATARYEVERFPRDRRLMRREVTAWREVR